eukprot:1189776-Prorocentrum_minimum.AAC.1
MLAALVLTASAAREGAPASARRARVSSSTRSAHPCGCGPRQSDSQLNGQSEGQSDSQTVRQSDRCGGRRWRGAAAGGSRAPAAARATVLLYYCGATVTW